MDGRGVWVVGIYILVIGICIHSPGSRFVGFGVALESLFRLVASGALPSRGLESGFGVLLLLAAPRRMGVRHCRLGGSFRHPFWIGFTASLWRDYRLGYTMKTGQVSITHVCSLAIVRMIVATKVFCSISVYILLYLFIEFNPTVCVQQHGISYLSLTH